MKYSCYSLCMGQLSLTLSTGSIAPEPKSRATYFRQSTQSLQLLQLMPGQEQSAKLKAITLHSHSSLTAYVAISVWFSLAAAHCVSRRVDRMEARKLLEMPLVPGSTDQISWKTNRDRGVMNGLRCQRDSRDDVISTCLNRKYRAVNSSEP